MEELHFETPHDKLLVMLVERVSNLEEKLEKNNALMEKILSLTTFKYFSISLSGKRVKNQADGEHPILIENDNIDKYLFDFVEFIDKRVPLVSTWVQFASYDKTICSLTIETSSKWLVRTIKDNLPHLHDQMEGFPFYFNGGWTESETVWMHAKLFAKKDLKTSKFYLDVEK